MGDIPLHRHCTRVCAAWRLWHVQTSVCASLAVWTGRWRLCDSRSRTTRLVFVCADTCLPCYFDHVRPETFHMFQESLQGLSGADDALLSTTTQDYTNNEYRKWIFCWRDRIVTGLDSTTGSTCSCVRLSTGTFLSIEELYEQVCAVSRSAVAVDQTN